MRSSDSLFNEESRRGQAEASSMLRSEKKAAAVGGRTARVCDSCLCKRARWFCAADDAFLCQACDVSVHSANQLARRHDRIRLETASFKSTDQSSPQLPPWLKGFTRKARTPRHNKQLAAKASVFSLVPEIGNDEGLLDDNEEQHNQFLHHHHQQVPVFDPFDEEQLLLTDELEDFGDGFLPSEVDLAEFVADVESLLGRRQDEDETQSRLLKVKDEEREELLEDQEGINNGFLGGDIMDWNFTEEEIEEEKVVPTAEDESKTFINNSGIEQELKTKKKKNIFLRLNYDAVITAWDGKSSPYTTGNRPEFDLDDCWSRWFPYQSVDKGALGGRGEWKIDGEREARVSRYREKRRTRLFSKKIRYQVRKLNAEKRPRMKGRFVKRTTPLMSSNHIAFP